MRRARLSGRAAIFALVLLVLAISYASSLRAWLQQRDEIAVARADLARTQASIDSLTLQKARWSDPAYVEQQARERFGWMLPGEVGYRVLNPDGTPIGGATELASPAPAPDSGQSSWYGSVWSSVQAAGREPTDPADDTQAPAPDPVIRAPTRHRPTAR